MVMTTPVVVPAAAAPAVEEEFLVNHENHEEHEDHEEHSSTHSAELHVEGIDDHRNEEERVTEAEKNERVQKQLMVRCGLAALVLPACSDSQRVNKTPVCICVFTNTHTHTDRYDMPMM